MCFILSEGDVKIFAAWQKTFIIRKDSETGLKYVAQGLDEMTKDHSECDKETIASIMPETPGMCNRFSCNII